MFVSTGPPALPVLYCYELLLAPLMTCLCPQCCKLFISHDVLVSTGPPALPVLYCYELLLAPLMTCLCPQAHPRYLSCIATSCFYIAAKVQEENGIIPSAADLVKLSQCGGTPDDLRRMERLILDKLHWELNSVTPLTFLRYFYEVFADKDPRVADPLVFSSLIARLEVLMCQFQFTKYRVSSKICVRFNSWLFLVLNSKSVFCKCQVFINPVFSFCF